MIIPLACRNSVLILRVTWLDHLGQMIVMNIPKYSPISSFVDLPMSASSLALTQGVDEHSTNKVWRHRCD